MCMCLPAIAVLMSVVKMDLVFLEIRSQNAELSGARNGAPCACYFNLEFGFLVYFPVCIILTLLCIFLDILYTVFGQVIFKTK